MTRQQRIERAFREYVLWAASRQQPTADAFLERQDPTLRDELIGLIADYERFQGEGDPQDVGFRPGRIIGPFRLLRELGRGTTGAVWEAERGGRGPPVALKLLHPTQSVLRFRREANALRRLDHPAIVKVLDTGITDDLHWIAQELVPGARPLSLWIRDHVARSELTSRRLIRRTTEQFLTLAEALCIAHRAGVVHRDLKPANILIDAGDAPHLVDFGLARVEDDVRLTRSSATLGTPCYLSPEQIAGGGTTADARTDLFSLGVTFYEALTGVCPFLATSRAAVYERIARHHPVDPRRLVPEIPAALALICGRMLEKRRARRYVDMQALADDLRQHLAGRPIQARAPGLTERARRWAHTHPALTLCLGLAGSIAVLMSWVTTTIAARNRELERVLATFSQVVQAPADGLDELQRVAPDLRTIDATALGVRAETAFDLAHGLHRCLLRLGNTPEDDLRRADQLLSLAESTLPDDGRRVALAHHWAGAVFVRHGEDEAADHHRAIAWQVAVRAYPEGSSELTPFAVPWSRLLRARGQPEEAHAVLERAVRASAAEPALLRPAFTDLFQLLMNAGDLPAARDLLDAYRVSTRRSLTLRDMSTRLRCEVALDHGMGNTARAVPKARLLVLLGWMQGLPLSGSNRPVLADTLTLATCLRDDGRLDEADALYRSLLDQHEPGAPVNAGHVHANLAHIALRRGDLGAASASSRRSRQGRLQAADPDVERMLAENDWIEGWVHLLDDAPRHAELLARRGLGRLGDLAAPDWQRAELLVLGAAAHLTGAGTPGTAGSSDASILAMALADLEGESGRDHFRVRRTHDLLARLAGDDAGSADADH